MEGSTSFLSKLSFEASKVCLFHHLFRKELKVSDAAQKSQMKTNSLSSLTECYTNKMIQRNRESLK